MITHDFYLKKADWNVRVYIYITSYHADEILDDLIYLGCKGENLKRAKSSLWEGNLNTGLTYSNLSSRETLIVIAKTSSGEECWNSLDHEKQHLLQDISTADGIDPFGEEICYISGEFIRDVFKVAKPLLCDCCRKKIRRTL